MAGRKSDLNISAAFTHVAVGRMVALGVTMKSEVDMLTAAQRQLDLSQ